MPRTLSDRATQSQLEALGAPGPQNPACSQTKSSPSRRLSERFSFPPFFLRKKKGGRRRHKRQDGWIWQSRQVRPTNRRMPPGHTRLKRRSCSENAIIKQVNTREGRGQGSCTIRGLQFAWGDDLNSPSSPRVCATTLRSHRGLFRLPHPALSSSPFACSRL